MRRLVVVTLLAGVLAAVPAGLASAEEPPIDGCTELNGPAYDEDGFVVSHELSAAGELSSDLFFEAGDELTIEADWVDASGFFGFVELEVLAADGSTQFVDAVDGYPATISYTFDGTETGVNWLAADGSGFEPVSVVVSCVREDVTPPVVTPPADRTVQTGSLAGALVFWPPATATDENPTNPVVMCDPASGSLFRLGSHVVECTATDAAGNEGSASFSVEVVLVAGGPTFDEAITIIEEADLPNAIETGLVRLHVGAKRNVENGDYSGACDKLASSINRVEAQRDKKIAALIADRIQETDRTIREALPVPCDDGGA